MLLITYEIATGNIHSVTALRESGKLAEWRAGRIPWEDVVKDFGAPAGMALEILGGGDKDVEAVAPDGKIPPGWSLCDFANGVARWNKDAKRPEQREETDEERARREEREAKQAARESLKEKAKSGQLSQEDIREAIRLLLS